MSVTGVGNAGSIHLPPGDGPAVGSARTQTASARLTSGLMQGNAELEQIAGGRGAIRLGARGDAPRLIQEALIELGYDLGRWGADGQFGRTSQRVVAQFQRDNNLTPDGIVGRNTLRMLDEKLKPAGLQNPRFNADPTLRAIADGNGTLARGARGPSVQLVQEALQNAGHRISADGIFGNGTAGAVRTFQRANRITPADGQVNQETLLALDGVAPQKTSDIVFLGMGDGASYEVKDLQKRAGVVGITDSAAGDDKVTVTIDGADQTFDLTEDAGILSYLDGIGLSGAKKQECFGIIKDAGSDTRDETALLIKTFAEAERGERVIERLVLSGHSVGSGVWGDNNGFFDMDLLRDTLGAFPNAAGQIEDFMIAGCYSNSEHQVEEFREMMPNVKTIWAYGDSAPGTWSGAMVHNSRWEAATRGHDPSALTRNVAAGTRKGENVATWNIEDGYMADGAQRPLSEIRADLSDMDGTYESYFSGEAEIRDTQYGPLRDYYRLVQEQLGNPALPRAERPALEDSRDKTIRLIYFDQTVKGRFQEAHGDAVANGFEALGLPPADFASLSRADALELIERFQTELADASPTPQAAADLLPLLEGLRDLDPGTIPNTWV